MTRAVSGENSHAAEDKDPGAVRPDQPRRIRRGLWASIFTMTDEQILEEAERERRRGTRGTKQSCE
jgi:hypothetical protein